MIELAKAVKHGLAAEGSSTFLPAEVPHGESLFPVFCHGKDGADEAADVIRGENESGVAVADMLLTATFRCQDESVPT